MSAWLQKHGSTLAMILVVAGMVQQYAPMLPGKLSGILLAVSGAVIKLIQSVTGTTSAEAPK